MTGTVEAWTLSAPSRRCTANHPPEHVPINDVAAVGSGAPVGPITDLTPVMPLPPVAGFMPVTVVAGFAPVTAVIDIIPITQVGCGGAAR